MQLGSQNGSYVLIRHICLSIHLRVVGCRHGLLDVLGPAELQALERSEDGILVTDNILWQPKV